MTEKQIVVKEKQIGMYSTAIKAYVQQKKLNAHSKCLSTVDSILQPINCTYLLHIVYDLSQMADCTYRQIFLLPFPIFSLKV